MSSYQTKGYTPCQILPKNNFSPRPLTNCVVHWKSETRVARIAGVARIARIARIARVARVVWIARTATVAMILKTSLTASRTSNLLKTNTLRYLESYRVFSCHL